MSSPLSRVFPAALLFLGLACAQACGGEPPVRLIAFGDHGTGGDGQATVAAAAATVCESLGCDLGLLLGDNFYDVGVTSADDPQFQEKYETHYAALGIPFHPVLGNHDYGALSNDWPRGQFQVEYSGPATTWQMPATHYALRVGDLGLLALDTPALFWDDITNGDQEAWLAGALAELEDAKVVIGLGHHPYLSNGRHGNAGNYDGVSGVAPLDGSQIKTFFDDRLCGAFDLYLAGHDHSRQWLEDDFCGAELIVSGAGGSGTTGLVEDRNPYRFQSNTLGLIHLTIEKSVVTGRFFDETGTLDFERTIEIPK